MFNRGTMIIACPACNTRYVVPDTAIGVEGRTVRCAKCRHSWFQEGPALDPAAAPQPAPVAPAPPPPPPPPPAPPPPVAEPADQPAWDEPAPVPAPAGPEADFAAPEPEPEPAAPLPPVYSDDPVAPPPPAAYYDETQSQFDHEPPFRPRRNPARMWTIAAALFAVVALGTVAAVAWYGLPSWVPFAQPMFADEKPGLKLDFPADQQGMRELEDRSWFFEANGAISNVSQTAQSVPTILVVLRDARGRVVYTGEITPPKRTLAPGETMSISQALVPVPRGAAKADYGWKPGR